jgi:hypothetical protein
MSPISAPADEYHAFNSGSVIASVNSWLVIDAAASFAASPLGELPAWQ